MRNRPTRATLYHPVSKKQTIEKQVKTFYHHGLDGQEFSLLPAQNWGSQTLFEVSSLHNIYWPSPFVGSAAHNTALIPLRFLPNFERFRQSLDNKYSALKMPHSLVPALVIVI